MQKTYTVRPGANYSGAPVGILLLDGDMVWAPGSVANASSYKYPVQFQVVKDLMPLDILEPPNKHSVAQIVKAAQALERNGARVIVGACGYFIKFQDQVASAVDVPVSLSSLFQIPMILNHLPPHKSLGVVTAIEGQVDDKMLLSSHVNSTDRITVSAINQECNFIDCGLGKTKEFIPAELEANIVETTKKMLAKYPSIGAILLECSEFPPYASAVSKATGLPVFDFISMIDYFAHSLKPRTFENSWY